MAVLTVNPGGGADFTSQTAALAASTDTADIIENQANITESLQINKNIAEIRATSLSIVISASTPPSGEVYNIDSNLTQTLTFRQMTYQQLNNGVGIRWAGVGSGSQVIVEDLIAKQDNGLESLRVTPALTTTDQLFMQRVTGEGAPGAAGFVRIQSAASAANSVRIQNCSMRDYTFGIRADVSTSTAILNLFNNTIEGCGTGVAVSCRGDFKNNLFGNNTDDLDSNGSADVVDWETNGWEEQTDFTGFGSGNFTVTSSDEWINEGAHDFDLKIDADSREAGTDLSGTFTDDIRGKPRPSPTGGAYDCGAFERQVIQMAGTATGTGLAQGNLTIAITVVNLAGTASGVGTAAGALTRIRCLTGQADGTGLAQGDLTRTRGFIGTANGVGNAQGAMERIRTFSGQTDGTGQAQGAMERVRTFSGQTDGTGNAQGSLNRVRCLTGTANGVGNAQGTTERVRTFSGDAAGTGQAAGAMERIRTFSGQTDGTGQAQGDIEVIFSFSGTASGTGQAQGAMERRRTFAGTANGIGTAAGDLQRTRGFNGQSDGTGQAQGAMERRRTFAATANGIGLAQGQMSVTFALSGQTDGAGLVQGTLGRLRTFSGQTDGTGDFTGELTIQLIPFDAIIVEIQTTQDATIFL